MNEQIEHLRLEVNNRASAPQLLPSDVDLEIRETKVQSLLRDDSGGGGGKIPYSGNLETFSREISGRLELGFKPFSPFAAKRPAMPSLVTTAGQNLRKDSGMAISGDFCASADILAVIGQTADGTTTAVCGQRTLIQANTSEIEIDRKYVTVLVIEIVNPLHAFGSIDPELILRQIDPLLESAREVIELNGGVIGTSCESGITAIFGTLPASRHHALSASRAALVVKSKLELQSNGSIRVRAGLDTGEVIVHHRSRGAANQIEVMGSAVRTATRLADEANQGRHPSCWQRSDTRARRPSSLTQASARASCALLRQKIRAPSVAASP